jgi:hypothetical protein
MNVEIGAEAALFPEKEYIKGIFDAVCMGEVMNTTASLFRSQSNSHPPANTARFTTFPHPFLSLTSFSVNKILYHPSIQHW